MLFLFKAYDDWERILFQGGTAIDDHALYRSFTDGELLRLTLELNSLTDSARQALFAELSRRGINDPEIARWRNDWTFDANKRARWRKIRLGRLKREVGIFLITPAPLFLIIAPLGFVVFYGLRYIFSVGAKDAITYAGAVVGIVTIAWLVAALVLFVTGRADRWLRRWDIKKSRKELSRSQRQSKFHPRHCAAQNLGPALLAFSISALLTVVSLVDVNDAFAFKHEATFTTFADVSVLGILVYLLISIPCLRERLWLCFAIVEELISFIKEVVPRAVAHEVLRINELSVFLWAGALVISLSLLKSALNASPSRTAKI